MRNMRQKNGFTLVELLVAMIVTSIVMTAIATLAYAMSSANNVTDDTSCKQAQVRFATLKLSDLIRNCKLICCVTDNDLVVWRADDNNDGKINIGELVYIENGSERDHLQICDFPSSNSTEIDLGSIEALSTNWWFPYSNDINCIGLIPECNNVQYVFDLLPPQSRFISISFDVFENDILHKYQISITLRGWAGNLLDDSGNIVSDDD